MSIPHLVYVALGGALGAVSRYLIVAWVSNVAGAKFPWGTLAVNVLGSFLLGTAFVYVVEKLHGQPELRSLIMVGFLGALTTFSTFSLEAWSLMQSDQLLQGLAYILMSVILCLFAVGAGIALTRLIL
ncbi:fluoride efflux transporter CrcB [Hahella aquimaris]|uniref:fluoride efflux transporter CrcB n=1 Tax=Hahella sp. HNIBRBA332 TaxID=3015983 RepID=UPI00273B03CD|nr:fluoride efflux transporter CrcB [Hahella sp. HNIBRBA332]WLQ15504.1 fluoride efflux transporter CrcB [Hahella sp. HNIBRBA332]